MTKNVVESEATNDVICRMRVARWASKPTREHAHARPRARAPTHVHARFHERARTKTNLQCVLLFHYKNNSRTHLSVTLYVHRLSCSYASSRRRPIERTFKSGPSPVLILTHYFLKSYFHITFFYQPASKLTVFLKILRRKVSQSVNNEL